MREIRLQKPG